MMKMEAGAVLEKVLSIVRELCDEPLDSAIVHPDTDLYLKPFQFGEGEVLAIVRELLLTYKHLKSPVADCSHRSMVKTQQRFATPRSITDWVLTESLGVDSRMSTCMIS